MNMHTPTQSKHTPGPWRISHHDTLKDVRHIDAGPSGYERKTVAIIDGKESDANAQFIVRAVNCHDELTETLEAACLRVEQANKEGNPILSAWLTDARAILAKVKGNV